MGHQEGALISQCQTAGRAHSLLSLGPHEPLPHPAWVRWDLGWQAAATEGKRMIPNFGRGPLLQSAQGKVLGNAEEQGLSSGGRG